MGDAHHITFSDLSVDALERMLCACTAKSVCDLAKTCRSVRTASQSELVWGTFLQRDFDIPKGILLRHRGLTVDLLDTLTKLDLPHFKPAEHRFLARLYSRIINEQPRLLQAHGFFTDAGMDDLDDMPTDCGEAAVETIALSNNHQMYWVANAFDGKQWSIYCSGSGVRNGTIGAVLLSTEECLPTPGSELEEARAYILERLSPLSVDLWSIQPTGFGGLNALATRELHVGLRQVWTAVQLRGRLLDGIPKCSHAEHMTRLARIVGIPLPSPSPSMLLHRLRIGNRSILVDQGNCSTTIETHVASVASVGATLLGPSQPPSAVISRVVIHRAISCSCPLQSGVIFGSRRPLRAADLCTHAMHVFDDVIDMEALRAREGADFPRVHWIHNLPDVQV